MTCIVDFKFKKDLIDAVRDKKDFPIEDPSIINPSRFMASEMFHGQIIIVTNHPKRSWFAQIRKDGGDLDVR